MKTVLLSVGGAVLSVLAFPPFGPGLLIVPGIALFLWAVLEVSNRRGAFWAGFLYGTVFFGGLMWWLVELETIALILIPVQALFHGVFGWWIGGYKDERPGRWLLLAVGGWAVMELVRYHFPVGGLEWGAAGYALSDSLTMRIPASSVGTSGLTVTIVMIAGLVTCAVAKRWTRSFAWAVAFIGVVLISTIPSIITHIDGSETATAIVQGSTPCPFEHCAPNERLRTYEQHLELTRTIEPGSVELVVWSEGSTGSTNADPVLNPEVAAAIGAEARRIGADMLIGGDRVVSEDSWVNANVYFDSNGEIVGEYRKQHPVPFGEYIPLRPLFEWIPALDRVPRDMIRGTDPVIFEENRGSVISFEGGFSRYALGAARAGADVIVVATNEASYGPDAPTSDQFIGMTRMRAVELGVPVIHAAVTGKSAFIEADGSIGQTSDLGEETVLYGAYGPGKPRTLFTAIGNSVMHLAALVGVLTWARIRRLVASSAQ